MNNHIPHKELKIGMIVEGRFTNSGDTIRSKGEIVKINQGTARIKCLKEMRGWEEGHIYVIATEYNKIFSINNGIFKIGDRT